MTQAADVKLVGSSLQIGGVSVSFERTLRIPEHGVHPRPPSLGRFPLRRVTDYPDTAPADWLAKGGVMLPVYQREAMWLSFDADIPAALKVGVGKVCAVSGNRWTDELSQDPQNYLAIPLQPWLDGINSGKGFVRQFVAVRHGLGATVEAQVTGEETHGGLQLAVHELTADAKKRHEAARARRGDHDCHPSMVGSPMGMGAGGRMRQEVYEDFAPLTDYQKTSSRVFVHLCSASQWRSITGEDPPVSPVSARAYTEAGLPWFDYYDADAADLPSSQALADVRPVGDWLGEDPDQEGLGHPGWVVQVGPAKGGTPVEDGAW